MVFKKSNLLFPLLILVLNIIFFLFLMEELIDASDPNYGAWGLSTPVLGFISFLYIRKFVEKKSNTLIRTLQGLNWIFILFPIVIFFYGIYQMVNY